MRATFVTLLTLTILRPHNALAQSATQTATFGVGAINVIAVHGTAIVPVNEPRASPAPRSTAVNGTSWAVTTNQTGARISARLESDLPAGLTLSIMMGAPAGATSAGFRPLGTMPVELVTNVSKVSASNLPITYRIDASQAAITIPTDARVVFTITNGM